MTLGRARILAVAGLVGALAGCTEPQQVDRLDVSVINLPVMRTFSAAPVTPTIRNNRQLAQDFLDLSFLLESGRPVPRMTRYEGEITVELRGSTDPVLSRDLDQLIARLRHEAHLQIRRAKAGETAGIVVEVLPRRELERAVPRAACFVVPRVDGWDEFRSTWRSSVTDWTTLDRREHASVFLPGDVSPQEARDCLHEEIAQALGPLNDLYRLPDSVFNDDNFHTVLTGFDMLMLEVYYDPALQNGMTRDEVASRLPAILARLNPAGTRRPYVPVQPTTEAWVDAIETALGPRGSHTRRQNAARRAVRLAREAGWNDTRLGFSLYASGRLALGHNSTEALTDFIEAGKLYRALPDTRVQEAHVAMQLAAFALSAGEPEATLALVEQNVPVARASENAVLLSTLLMLRAEALERMGQRKEAKAVQTEALGWARYGFGTPAVAEARTDRVAALAVPGPGG
ncbi:DUF2927 domain-containing protein [Tropicimonas sp. IMCC34043]|uniref:DUF2927 domain-containing protein n=1 Tax=Tropicimonas sp. IMCC34043 TaxID=2248760 RepID=UPI001E5903E1|nr:DUF2927 domain-containing protein [Tropicimonas sp. IMCC34043]